MRGCIAFWLHAEWSEGGELLGGPAWRPDVWQGQVRVVGRLGCGQEGVDVKDQLVSGLLAGKGPVVVWEEQL